MKKILGLCILLIVLVAASGCTQPAAQPTVTPAPTTEVVTEVATAEPTMPAATPEETEMPAATTQATAKPTVKPTANVTKVATATPAPALTHSKTTTIYIRNNTFVPKEIMVLPGTGITWVNEDKTVHAIKTLPDIGIKFTSSDMMSGASFSYTFGETEGTFGFIDPYTNVTGMVIIKRGASVVGAPTLQSSKS